MVPFSSCQLFLPANNDLISGAKSPDLLITIQKQVVTMITSPLLAFVVICRAKKGCLNVAVIVLRTKGRAGIRYQNLAGCQVCEKRSSCFCLQGNL